MTSEVHKKFVKEPMGDKSVRDLAGVGDKLGARLEEKGINKASQVFGQFHRVAKDEGQLKQWMHKKCGANSFQAGQTYACLKEWNENYMQ